MFMDLGLVREQYVYVCVCEYVCEHTGHGREYVSVLSQIKTQAPPLACALPPASELSRKNKQRNK